MSQEFVGFDVNPSRVIGCGLLCPLGAVMSVPDEELLQLGVQVTRNEQYVIGQGFVEPDFEAGKSEATSQLECGVIGRVHGSPRK